MKSRLTPLTPVLLLFLALVIFFSSATNLLTRWNADQDVLLVGNFLLLVITLVSYFLIYRGIGSANNHSFTRSVYISFIVKFFLILALVFIYASMTKEINKNAVIICALIYLVYNFMEVAALTKLAKGKKNA